MTGQWRKILEKALSERAAAERRLTVVCVQRDAAIEGLMTAEERIADLGADKERLLFTLESSMRLLTMALDGMPNGAFRNAVREEELPGFVRIIDAARQKGQG